MSKRDLLIKIFLPLLILAGAVAITFLMVKSRDLPQPRERQAVGPLVRVMEVHRQARRVTVEGTGTVQPSREVAVTPQVSGEVVDVSPSMVVGGFLREGDLMFAIEDTDYRLALETARAGLAQTELELARIAGQAEVARLEWQRLAADAQEKPNPLVLFEPQLHSAEAGLAAAEAAVEQARLDLQRTRLRAPFNAYVRSENLEVGQYVRTANSVAVLAGTDEVEIMVPLPLEEIDWFRLPDSSGQGTGAAAEIGLQLGDDMHTWQGRVERLLGDVDPQNRMASVVVSVTDPFGLKAGSRRAGRPLAPGTFVQVAIEGRSLDQVLVVPRLAVHDDETVWVVDSDRRLQLRPVEVLRRERDEVLIGAGLEDGEQVVLTNLSGAADGMLVRPQPTEAKP